MLHRRHILIVTLLLAGLWSCQEKVDDIVSIKARSATVEATAAEVFVEVSAVGSWTLSLEFPSGDEPWATISPTSGTGEKRDVRLKYQANTSDDARTLTMVVTSALGASARASVTQAGKGTAPVIGSYGYDVAPMTWLELPASVMGDGREVLVHDMSGKKYVNKAVSGTRNWSCYWDYHEHLSLWVAYPLNASLIGTGSRTDAWGFDPILPTNIQPSLTGGSYGGGWARGHQLPSADRLSYSANVSTFVPTNMTPQNYNFNGGIWAKLEDKVRTWSKNQADTLYVVTGALFDKSTSYSGTSSGFAVKIPTHYFKALLYKGGNSDASATGGYMMCGFYLPHDSSISKGNCLDYKCSIDELEQYTGIDFFPNLEKRDKALSVKLEAAAPAAFWK